MLAAKGDRQRSDSTAGSRSRTDRNVAAVAERARGGILCQQHTGHKLRDGPYPFDSFPLAFQYERRRLGTIASFG